MIKSWNIQLWIKNNHHNKIIINIIGITDMAQIAKVMYFAEEVMLR